eukprot:10884574-Prorocentrum_lima.AAC.1
MGDLVFSHLVAADDLILASGTATGLCTMVNDLNIILQKAGLHLNPVKSQYTTTAAGDGPATPLITQAGRIAWSPYLDFLGH